MAILNRDRIYYNLGNYIFNSLNLEQVNNNNLFKYILGWTYFRHIFDKPTISLT